MTDSCESAGDTRRGVALLMVLAAMALLGSLTLLALHAALIRVRLAADARWRIEGALVASTALAATRIGNRAELDTLADGTTMVLPTIARPDGWSWHAEVGRAGPLIRIVVFAQMRASDGGSWAARRASLMLARDPADTVRVLGSRARF